MDNNTKTRTPDFSVGENPLFQPFRLGPLTLPNRIVMAPMTRCMAGEGFVPTDDMAAYYARRADAGLLVTEGAIVRSNGHGYPNTPGIYTQAQVDGWKKVTERVHEAGGRIYAQLWHVGRVSHPVFLNGEPPIAPSAVPLDGEVPRHRDLKYGTPRALEASEIAELIGSYQKAASNAMEAGFDGVEIHGANGYLIDQFLHYHTNRREDDFGGMASGMVQFPLSVVDAISEAIGGERLGIRLSPAAYHHMDSDPRDATVFRMLLTELDVRTLAYIHTGIAKATWTYDYLGGTVREFLRKNYRGTLMSCGGYTPETAAAALEAREAELIAIGRPFIANPDYVAKAKEGVELTEYEPPMLETLR